MGIWIEYLKAAGVDLLAYGKKEKALHDGKTTLKEVEFVIPDYCDRRQVYTELRTLEFTYGASPSD